MGIAAQQNLVGPARIGGQAGDRFIFELVQTSSVCGVSRPYLKQMFGTCIYICMYKRCFPFYPLLPDAHTQTHLAPKESILFTLFFLNTHTHTHTHTIVQSMHQIGVKHVSDR